MLTSTERSRLENRASEDPSVRSRNEHAIRHKLSKWLKDLDDAVLILNLLPQKQSEKLFVEDETIYKLFELTSAALGIRGFMSVYGNRCKPFVSDTNLSKVRPATVIDIDRSRNLQGFIENLKMQYNNDPKLVDEILAESAILSRKGEPSNLAGDEDSNP